MQFLLVLQRMIQLSKIKINNIRKFGADIEIPIESGATIFLAPNGTGKTSLFEAIELALTGGVQRLKNSSLDNIIRDKLMLGGARLDFNNNLYCESSLMKGARPVISGDHKKLFGTIKEENIPFLLRITHLLDQQSNKWFMHTDGINAGSLLQNLSIGRDAIKANDMMSSAKRAATIRRDQAESKRREAKAAFDIWTNLIERKGLALSTQAVPLQPLNSLVEIISQLLTAVGRPVQIINKNDLTATTVHAKETEAAIKQLLENLRGKSLELEKLRYVVSEYERLLIDRNDHETPLEQQAALVKHIVSENTVRQEQLLSVMKRVTTLQEELAHSENAKKQSDLRIKLIEDARKSQQNLTNLKLKIADLQNEIYTANNDLNALQRLMLQNEQLDNKLITLSEQRRLVASLQQMLYDWKLYDSEIESRERSITEIEVLVSKQKTQTERLKMTCLEHTQQVKDLSLNFNQLNTASDAIKEAVGIIAVNFPKDRNDCPVCLSTFPPLELQEKIARAIASIDPQLNLAHKNLDIAKQQLDVSTRQLYVANQELELTISNLEAHQERINDLRRIISDDIVVAFEGSQQISHAANYIERIVSALRYMEQSYQEERSKLDNAPKKESILNLQSFIKQTEQLLNSMQSQQADLLQRLDQTEQQLQLMKSFDNQSQMIPSTADILTLSQNLNHVRIEADRLKNERSERQFIYDKEIKKLEELENKRRELNQRLADVGSFWQNYPLSGTPNAKTFLSELEKLQGDLRAAEELDKTIKGIAIELEKWQAREKYETINSEIDLLKGELTEEQYDNRLKKELEDSTTRLETTLEQIGLLNTFSGKLTSEIDSINEKLQSVNPYWKMLLKRIVVDPRFSEANLHSWTYYKKQYADVKVNLHGGTVLASDIASEAQITDLQLTFLLSMAYKYQWTNWKCLLLDDPTQHHDLVHAAGVFDLLRDYIVDHQFQILLATHDPIQARFFMRKLENDGIPAKLWTLQAGENGVFAKVN